MKRFDISVVLALALAAASLYAKMKTGYGFHGGW